MKTLSLVMIVRDEEKVLERCLESIKQVVDEIIVVDTGSRDTTKSIAVASGAKIYDYKWNFNFSEARNFALEQASSDWNLVLDADEYLSNDCSDEIRRFINNNHCIGRIRVINKFKDKEGDSYAQTFISRLFPRDVRYVGSVHEQLDSRLPRVKLSVEVQHDGYYDQSRSERNIPLLQREINDSPKNAYYNYQIAKEYRGLEKHDMAYKHLEQAYLYVDKRALYYPNIFVDYIYAAMACNKLEQILIIVEQEGRNLNDFTDFQFVLGLFYLDLIMKDPTKYVHLLPEIENCYKRCLEIGETDTYDGVIGTGSFAAYHNLGVFYEVTGNIEKALACYQASASYHYEPSMLRLVGMGTN